MESDSATSGNSLSSTVISSWSSAAGTAVVYQHLEARNAYVQRGNIKKEALRGAER